MEVGELAEGCFLELVIAAGRDSDEQCKLCIRMDHGEAGKGSIHTHPLPCILTGWELPCEP